MSEIFHNICQQPKLPGEEMAELPEDPQEKPTHNGIDVDALVQQVRQKTNSSIVMRCGMMRVLGVSQPVGLHDIYTSVNILEQISGRRRLEITDLLNVCGSDEFERPGLGSILEQRVPGLEAVGQYSKLMLLGKPGAGKTTFLKHVAIQCSLGEFQANRVPIFITLKDFAETEQQPSLLEYITGQFAICGVTDKRVAEQVLSLGRALVLLDGLDEVTDKNAERVCREVRNFCERFHDNHFVVSCRIAAREYTFEQFTEVEVADFDDEQIATFATKWFATKDPIKGKIFIKKLKENDPIRELATNPLLLTLLCLIFEESTDFPSNRSELYKEGIDVLLKKWDAKRNIEREQVYKNLSLKHKEDMLGKIALSTFERGDYFFSQEEVEQQIADYIQNIPSYRADAQTLQLHSSAVLKSIEAQHGLLVERAFGIYSFSHLTFQEYFTAKEIVTVSDPQALERALRHLITHFTQKRWREVFLLSVGMLRNADYLLQLIKQHIDNVIVQDQQLQKFLTWLSQKSRAVTVPYNLAAIRAFYLDLSLNLDIKLNPAHSLALKIAPTLGLALKLDLELDRELDFALSLTRTLDFTLAPSLACSLECVIKLTLNREIQGGAKLSPLRVSLQQLKAQLPDPTQGEESFERWWKAKGGVWTEQLRALAIKHRNIGHDWLFNARQKQALQQYHDANMLLMECVNSASYMTHAVRQEIEETLLLPIPEIEQGERSSAWN